MIGSRKPAFAARLSVRRIGERSRCSSDGLSNRSAASHAVAVAARLDVVVVVALKSPSSLVAVCFPGGRYFRSLASIGFRPGDRSAARFLAGRKEGGDLSEFLLSLPFDWVSGHGKISGSMGKNCGSARGFFPRSRKSQNSYFSRSANFTLVLLIYARERERRVTDSFADLRIAEEMQNC